MLPESKKYVAYMPIIKQMIHSFQILNLHFLTYIDSDKGIKIKYPVEWIVIPNPISGLIAVQFNSPPEGEPPTSKAFVNIVHTNLPSNSSLAKLTNFILNIREQNSAWDISKKGPTVLAGLPAYRILFLLHNPLLLIQQAGMEVWTVKGHTVYDITYSVSDPVMYSKFYSTAKSMIDSFNIIK